MGFFTTLRWRIQDLTTKRLSRKQVQNYWRSPTKGNAPEYYDAPSPWSPYLLELIKEYVQPTDSVLEIGCNCGRNLDYLRTQGYTKLAGIEISPGPIVIMNRSYSDLAGMIELFHAPVEEVVPGFAEGQFHLIYSIGVLEHVHRDSDFIFRHIARAAKKYVVTIEEEQGISKLHFPRNYKKIFERLGFQELRWQDCDERPELRGSQRPYIARLFAKVR